MPKRTLKLSTERLYDLDTAELAAVAGGATVTCNTITFQHGPVCHPSLQLNCPSLRPCIDTG